MATTGGGVVGMGVVVGVVVGASVVVGVGVEVGASVEVGAGVVTGTVVVTGGLVVGSGVVLTTVGVKCAARSYSRNWNRLSEGFVHVNIKVYVSGCTVPRECVKLSIQLVR